MGAGREEWALGASKRQGEAVKMSGMGGRSGRGGQNGSRKSSRRRVNGCEYVAVGSFVPCKYAISTLSIDSSPPLSLAIFKHHLNSYEQASTRECRERPA